MSKIRLRKMSLPLAIASAAIVITSFAAGGGAGADDSATPMSTTIAKGVVFLEPTGEDPTPPSVTGVEYLLGDGKVIGDKPLHVGENVFPFQRRADGTCDTPRNLGSYGVEGSNARGHGSVDISVDDNCNVIARLDEK